VLAISLAVAAIPESLPAVVALSLALAARRMTGRGVLARRLAAVEALGSVTVIAADKTGTLTEGRMALAEVWTPTGTADDDAHGLLQAAALCNDAYANGQPGERDDPTELALVDAAINLGIDAGIATQIPAAGRGAIRGEYGEDDDDARLGRRWIVRDLQGLAGGIAAKRS
jgi:Ca2+-transporting ATPase